MGIQTRQEKRQRRHKRIRSRMHGTSKIPRLCVFKSNQYIYAQLIDDEKGKIVAAAKGEANIKKAKEVGKAIAKKAQEKKIEKVVFDRGGYPYHGRVKALAESCREAGLKF